MIGLLGFALAVLAGPFKSKMRLEAENAVLRQQLIVLRRRLHGRVRLTNSDRWFFILPYRWVFATHKEKLRMLASNAAAAWISFSSRCCAYTNRSEEHTSELQSP